MSTGPPVRERRFLVEPADLGDAEAFIRGGELRHLRQVLRLKAGDPVSVFDGEGRGYRGRLRVVEKERAVVGLEEPDPGETEPEPAIHLFQSILHTDRMEHLVEKVTELGVREVTPVVSERSVVRPGRERWGRLERLRRIAVAAAKQSGRLRVPRLHQPLPFAELGAAGPAGGGPLRLICLRGGPSLPDRLAAAPGAGEVHLLVGPEGGWTGEEEEAAAARGWQGAGLGPTTLRADTAAVLAAGLILCLAGRPGGAGDDGLL